MMAYPVLLFMLLICQLFCSELRAQSESSALSWRMNTAYNQHLMREVHRQYDDRRQALEIALESPGQMEAYLAEKQRSYQEILGPLPRKYPLDAELTARKETAGFIIENIVFQSLPGRYVTANLYLPKGKGPFPVALELCGHGIRGKISPGQLRLAHLFTANGMALMVVDPIGQGERIQFLDEEGQSRTRGATTEHTLLNAGANLLGTSLAALEYWDNHRALDYLEERGDIRSDAMGVFGSSGGGTQTSYMLGLDKRIRVASVCSYFTRREKVLEIYGPSDGCQHIPYEGREGLEIADFVMMMAPGPVLIMSGKYDFVDYYGAQQAFGELKSVYDVLGYPEHVSMFSTEGGHGMPESKKIALVRWFTRHLVGDSLEIPEIAPYDLELDFLQCSATAQVLTAYEDSKSVQQDQFEQALAMQERRDAFLAKGPGELRSRMSELLGFAWPEADLHPEQTGVLHKRTFDVEKYQLIREGEMPLPCLLLLPPHLEPQSKVIIYLHEGGKDDVLGDETTVLGHINAHDILVLADLRGYGETSDPLRLNDTKYWNREYRNAMSSMHIGKPIMGQRVTDIIGLVDFAGEHEATRGRNVHLMADGSYGPAAVHAAFLDERIETTQISGSVKSFMDYLEQPMQRDVYSNVLYGVLQYYDLKDLVEMAGGKRIRFVD